MQTVQLRTARNFIAHEGGERFYDAVRSEQARESWRVEIETKVREIAMEKLVLSLLLPQISAVARPSFEVLRSYPDKGVRWVFAPLNANRSPD